MGEFILSNIDRTYLADIASVKKYDGMTFREWEQKNRGHALVGLPYEGHVRLNTTGPPAFISGIYYSLVFQLRRWEYFVQKFDEFIAVNPAHQQYFQLTVKQKQELEQQIKAGLGSAAQSVADLEMLLHDERKYREFLDYFGFEYDEAANAFKEKAAKDEHSLRSVFIDQVDVHTGEGIAIRTIVSRWPTLIVDFMKLTDDDTDPDKVKEKLDVSKAEAVVLVTKNKLYMEWKKLFGAEIRNRYTRIRELVRSRQESVNQYREWLKPYVARHKMMKEEVNVAPGGFSTFFIQPIGHATSYSEIVIWTWREFATVPPELMKGGTELLGQQLLEKITDPYDDWTKKNLIFHPRHGLAVDYPWITEEWVIGQRDWMQSVESQTRFNIRPWVDKGKLYYGFFIITLEKTNLRMPTGAEVEDGTFDVNFGLFSKNVMFAKLLELRAKQADFDHYIDKLIGVANPACPICKGAAAGKKPKIGGDMLAPVKNFFGFFGMNFLFSKGGPYERDFDERVVKYYIRPAMASRFAPVVRYIKQKAGMGQG